MRFIIILVSFLSLNSSHAQNTDVPFVPAYAWEQPQITFDSLGGEINQFQQWSNLQNLRGNIERQRLEVETRRKSYERGKSLVHGDGISKDELRRREYRYQISEGELGEMESRAQTLRISLESTKIGVMMNGDPTLDLRKELAQKMKESLEYQMKALNFALANAKLTEAYEAKEAADALVLLNKKVISQSDYDQRLQQFEGAKIHHQAVLNQIDVINKAILGLSKSLDRLF